MNTAQVKQAIKKSAQQIRQEPLELLRTAAKQVTGSEIENGPVSNDQAQTPQDEVKDETKYKQQVAEKDGRHLQALEAELKDIRRQKLFNELMRRIQSGEDVPLEEFTELSYEQKDVLKAQIEVFKKQQAIQLNQSGGLPEPSAKKGRKMGGGQKGAAKKEQTRVEKSVPPSG